jgi:hypothetical protein
MDQLTLFNTYAICRDYMEDALVSKDNETFRRYERLADKIYYRLNGRPFCPICGRTGGSWEHESNCARKLRRRAEIVAIHHAAADYVANLDERVS